MADSTKTAGSARARAPVDRPNRCPEAELAEGVIAAVNRLASAEEAKAGSYAAIAEALTAMVPAAEVVHGVGERLDLLCVFLRRKWPLLVGGALAVASASNAISPNAAAALKAAINTLGGG